MVGIFSEVVVVLFGFGFGFESVGNNGKWFKLLRGEVDCETDPEERGDCGASCPNPSPPTMSRLAFSGDVEDGLGLGGLSSKENKLDGSKASAVGLIGAPPVKSMMVPASISGISVGEVTA